MAATTHDRKDDKAVRIVRFPKPLLGIAKRGRKKRLPALSSDDIEDIFSSADTRERKKGIAA